MEQHFRQVIKEGSTGESVTFWTIFLQYSGFLDKSSNVFDDKVVEATKKFQEKHGLLPDGEVGKITWGFASSVKHPAPNIIKSENDLLQWLHDNLDGYIKDALNDAEKDAVFCESTLCAMAARETGFLFVKYLNRGKTLQEIAALLVGDFTNGQYHGFSAWQIDIRSFPDFINSGKWKNITESAKKAVEILTGKKEYLIKHFPDMDLTRAIIAAYNTGEGNVKKSIDAGKDVDTTTAHENYSADVIRMKDIYCKLANE